MAQRIEPFHRVSDRHANDLTVRGWAVTTVRLMRVHFTVLGVLLLIGAVALGIYLYSLDLGRISISDGLRITRQGDIYEPDFQLKVLGVLVLAVTGVVNYYTAHLLTRCRRSGLSLARLTALLPIAGFPIGVFLLVLVGNAESEDGGTFEQVLTELSLLVRIGAGLLVLQSLLAMWYEIATLLPPVRRYCSAEAPLGNPMVRRIRIIGLAVWIVVVIGLAVLLGVMTDWIYELPVSVPEPGELLYATSFDNFNSEWDLYPGRDSASVVHLDDLAEQLGGSFDPALADNVLVIDYGAGVSEQVIWSTLDRKFNDFDLRVTARLLEGPVDQNQFGVIFRYRDENNFYVFRVTADGYYSLVKVQDGVQEKISDWGLSDVINQGLASNSVRVVARGDVFRFFINDIPVPLCMKGTNESSMWANWEGTGICYTDELRYLYEDDTFGQGRIALTGGTIDGSDVTVVFDDLVIVGPEPDVMTVMEEAE